MNHTFTPDQAAQLRGIVEHVRRERIADDLSEMAAKFEDVATVAKEAEVIVRKAGRLLDRLEQLPLPSVSSPVGDELALDALKRITEDYRPALAILHRLVHDAHPPRVPMDEGPGLSACRHDACVAARKAIADAWGESV